MLKDSEGNIIQSDEEVHVDDHMPTDEELSAAFDGFVENHEEPIVEVAPVQPLVEPIVETTIVNPEHGEMSRLGRKVARMENLFETIAQNMVTKDDILKLKESPALPEEEDISDITNREELDKYFDKRFETKLEARERRIREEREKAKTRYEDDYLGTMKHVLSGLDQTIARDVYKEMVYNDEFNIKHSNDAKVDVARNFSKAYEFVLSKKKVSSPFDSNREPSVPSGVTPSTVITNTQAKQVPKLEDDAYEFAKSTGMSDEDIIEALDGETPLNLIGKVSA
jgi:hypothetical protein